MSTTTHPNHPGRDCFCLECIRANRVHDHPDQFKLIIALCDALDIVRDLIHEDVELPNDIHFDLPHIEWILDYCESSISCNTVSNPCTRAREQLLYERRKQRRKEARARESVEATVAMEVKPTNGVAPSGSQLECAASADVTSTSANARKKNYWEAD